MARSFIGRKKTTIDLIPSVLFGITKDWSIFFNFPFTPLIRDGSHESSGLEDFFIQLEYAFYNKTTSTYADQATIVGNITFPTGSIKKNPPTGFGSPSLFLGGTYYHVLVDWFLFTSHGAVLTTSENGTKFGDQFLYQFGLGRNIPSPSGWIYAWMVEIDGQGFAAHSYICRCVNDLRFRSLGQGQHSYPSRAFFMQKRILQDGFSVACLKWEVLKYPQL